MKLRTVLRSIARHRMKGVKHLNRPYSAQGEKGAAKSPFARHWREKVGGAPSEPSKKRLFPRFKRLKQVK